MERFGGGNRTFREGYFREHAELFLELRQGQHPVALYIGCSDSRVPIEQIVNAVPGDLYVVRTMGGIVPPSYYADAGLGASIEHAVLDLQVPHAVVCGHYGCGLISALIEGATAFSGFRLPLSAWLGHARPVLGRVSVDARSTDDERTAAARRMTEENARLQTEHLRTYDCVKLAEAAGRLQVHTWVYDQDTGTVLEERGGEFGPLA